MELRAKTGNQLHPDGFENGFYSCGTASNFWRSSKAKRVDLVVSTFYYTKELTFKSNPWNNLEIWKHSFISTVRPTVHTNQY